MSDFLGGPMHGGPMSGGPMHGGPMNGNSLALTDSFADSLHADALIKHRGGIVDLSPKVNMALWTLGDRKYERDRSPVPDEIDGTTQWPEDEAHLLRWDPWVRAYLASFECTRYLDFKLTDVPPPLKDDESRRGSHRSGPTLQLFVNEPGQGKAVELFSMTRPSQAVYEGQLKLVLNWAELREERTAEILTQANSTVPFWGGIIPFQTDRLRRTRELLSIAEEMAVMVEMRFKHELAAWRPADFSSLVQPMVTTPGHGSTPSGHCTQGYMTAEVLKALLDCCYGEHGLGFPPKVNQDAYASVNRQLQRTAARMSTNRVIAGLHFPVDNVAGRLLGVVLGEYFVYRCGFHFKEPKAPPAQKAKLKIWHRGKFDGARFGPSEMTEFDPVRQKFWDKEERPPYYEYELAKYPKMPTEPPHSLLQTLWVEAVKEVKALELKFE